MISNPEVNRTLATLRKAEFGFFGVIVEKLTDKSPLLPLYRTVHEIFTSYGSSFNSFEFIGSFSAFENPPRTQLTTFIVLCSPKSNSSQNLTQKVLSWNPILTKDSCGSGGSNYRRTRNGGLSPLSARLFGLKNAGFKNESLPFSDPDCPT